MNRDVPHYIKRMLRPSGGDLDPPLTNPEKYALTMAFCKAFYPERAKTLLAGVAHLFEVSPALRALSENVKTIKRNDMLHVADAIKDVTADLKAQTT